MAFLEASGSGPVSRRAASPRFEVVHAASPQMLLLPPAPCVGMTSTGGSAAALQESPALSPKDALGPQAIVSGLDRTVGVGQSQGCAKSQPNKYVASLHGCPFHASCKPLKMLAASAVRWLRLVLLGPQNEATSGSDELHSANKVTV